MCACVDFYNVASMLIMVHTAGRYLYVRLLY